MLILAKDIYPQHFTNNMFKRIKEDINAAINNDPAAPRSKFAIYFTYPGVIALRKYRKAHAYYKRGFKTIAAFISFKARKRTGIEIHPAAQIGRRVFIDHGMGIVIGETSIIGDDVVVYHGVTLGTNSKDKIDRHPRIGNRVTLYANATLIGRITIGDDSIIGANVILSKDVPAGSYVKIQPNITIEPRYK